MRINAKENDLSKCISADQMRPNLNAPYLLESGELVATNGHILAVIPGVKEEADTAGWVSLEAIKAAGGDSFKANGSCQLTDGRSYPRPNAGNDSARYPDVLKVIPKAEDARPVVTLNADYIMACAKAIKAGSKNARTITLWATSDKPEETAWFITESFKGEEKPDLTRPYAVIMPARR